MALNLYRGHFIIKEQTYLEIKDRRIRSEDLPYRLPTPSPIATHNYCGLCRRDPSTLSSLSLECAIPNNEVTNLFGGSVTLSCPQRHSYCTSCLRTWLRERLEAAEEGQEVFPIRCPGCITGRWHFGSTEMESLLNADELRRLVRITPLSRSPHVV
jgi:hypothetical protein